MRLGITLGGGFSPGPSKIFFNNSSLVAIVSHRNLAVRCKRQCRYNFNEVGPRLCPVEVDNNELGLVSYLLQGKSDCV